MNLILAAACSFQLLLPSCQGVSLAVPQGEINTLQVQGLERSYRTFNPLGLGASQEIPLLFVFHGGSGNAKQAQRHFGFDDLAREKHFMVVYPEAVDGHWNDGRKGEKFAAQDAKVDDVAYFRAVLAQVTHDHKVDSSRIYAMGASNGGMFVQRLALEETKTFAAVASTISSLPKPLKVGFQPKAPLSVLFMSGTEDPIMPFEGGEVVFHLFGGKKKRRWEKSRGQVLPVREAAQLWIAHNKIQAPEKDMLLPDLDNTDDCQVRRRIWQGKNAQDPVVALYEVIGGGHTLPQLKSRAPKRVVGNTNGDINTQRVIWRFFAGKRRQVVAEVTATDE